VRELGVTSLHATANFGFTAKLWGVEVEIDTEPTNEDETEIRILAVRMSDKALQRAGIWSRKVGFCYHMQRGENETGEQYCELPVSVERFVELMSDAEIEGTAAYNDVKSALTNLTKLQGYDRLLGFKLELPKETDEGDDD
jgi:hypothetical protein